MKLAVLLVLFAAAALPARAAVHAAPVLYEHDGVKLEGWSAYDDARSGPRPGILVIHQWKGLSAYEKKRAEMLAELGYNVFCVDIYGQGIRPATHVTIEQVRSGLWGDGGNKLRTDEVLARRAARKTSA